jgi:hypothetical protein
MTINRILVALDLIEIRKEMVLRVDEQGHKWRVPHNLYRVKDRSGDPHLTAQDVLRVLELAEERKDVYRHIRHILTSGFVPISRNNIWHRILEEIRPTPLWQRLAALALEEEARFSARSKAGHASRAGISAAGEPSPGPATQPDSAGDLRPLLGPDNDPDFYVPGSDSTAAVVTGAAAAGADRTSAGRSNDGFQTSVAATNRGLDGNSSSSGGRSNDGQATSVAPSNPMYDQSIQANRTRKETRDQGTAVPVTTVSQAVTAPVTRGGDGLSQVGNGPGEGGAPADGPGRAAALVAFAEANGRVVSAAEERLLARIAAEVESGRSWAIVTAAIYEAVDSGSAFVAPKRVREIVRRWQRDGLPAEVAAELGDEVVGGQREHFPEGTGGDRGLAVDVTESGPFWVAEAGMGSAQLWAAVVDLVSQQGEIRGGEVHDYLKPAVLLERTGATSLRLGVAHELARQRIDRRWRTSLEDALGRLLGGTGWELDVEVIGGASRKSA